MSSDNLSHLWTSLYRRIYLRQTVDPLKCSSEKEKSKDLNIYGSWTDHVPTRLPPTPTQPSTSSFSSLLSWLQSKATLLRGLTRRAPNLLFSAVNWSVLNGLQQSMIKESLKTVKQGNDMFLYICATNTLNACICTTTCLSVYLCACVYLCLCPFIAPRLS